MKTYIIQVKGYGEAHEVVAESRGKAVYRDWLSFKDAFGFKSKMFHWFLLNVTARLKK